MITRRQGDRLGQSYIIHAIMARITGKEMIRLHCVPFGEHSRIPIRRGSRRPRPAPGQAAPTKLAEAYGW
jgi:hypothetical protein